MMIKPTRVTTLINDNQNSNSPKKRMPKKLMMRMATMKIDSHAAIGTSAPFGQYRSTILAATMLLGVTMRYLKR